MPQYRIEFERLFGPGAEETTVYVEAISVKEALIQARGFIHPDGSTTTYGHPVVWELKEDHNETS